MERLLRAACSAVAADPRMPAGSDPMRHARRAAALLAREAGIPTETVQETLKSSLRTLQRYLAGGDVAEPLCTAVRVRLALEEAVALAGRRQAQSVPQPDRLDEVG